MCVSGCIECNVDQRQCNAEYLMTADVASSLHLAYSQVTQMSASYEVQHEAGWPKQTGNVMHGCMQAMQLDLLVDFL